MCMRVDMEADDTGVLAHTHGKRTRLEEQGGGLTRAPQEGRRGSDGSYLPGWPVPRLVPKDYHTGLGLERGLERGR